MYDSPVGYPKGKKGFLDDFFFWIWLQRVKVFIWSFISGGRFSIILRISSGAAKDKPEDERNWYPNLWLDYSTPYHEAL